MKALPQSMYVGAASVAKGNVAIYSKSRTHVVTYEKTGRSVFLVA